MQPAPKSAAEACVIELLGVGVPRDNGGWLLRHVCASFDAGQVSAVLGRDPDERRALLDAASGRVVPPEGRVWVNHVPLMRDTAGRIRTLVADIGPEPPLVQARSALWNVRVLPGARGLLRLLRYPRVAARQAGLSALTSVGLRERALTPVGSLSPSERVRVRLARASAGRRRPLALTVREMEDLTRAEMRDVLITVRALARAHRLAVLVALADRDLATGVADRILELSEGLLVDHDRVRARAAAAQ